MRPWIEVQGDMISDCSGATRLREGGIARLRRLTNGVTLLTYPHPDMPPREVTSRRTKWGQQFKNRKGGGDRKPGLNWVNEPE